jgi:hypothetical protein
MLNKLERKTYFISDEYTTFLWLPGAYNIILTYWITRTESTRVISNLA